MEVFIKREMLRRGISNRQLAQALGVGDSYASGISRGDKNLSMNTLQQVADVLGVPVWRLLAPDDALPSAEGAGADGQPQAVCPHCGRAVTVRLE